MNWHNFFQPTIFDVALLCIIFWESYQNYRFMSHMNRWMQLTGNTIDAMVAWANTTTKITKEFLRPAEKAPTEFSKNRFDA